MKMIDYIIHILHYILNEKFQHGGARRITQRNMQICITVLWSCSSITLWRCTGRDRGSPPRRMYSPCALVECQKRRSESAAIRSLCGCQYRVDTRWNQSCCAVAARRFAPHAPCVWRSLLAGRSVLLRIHESRILLYRFSYTMYWRMLPWE